MKSNFRVSTPGLWFEVLKNLQHNGQTYQTASLIGNQMIIPPEAASRMSMRDGRKKLSSAGKVVGRMLSKMFQAGRLERRKNSDGTRYEYRVPIGRPLISLGKVCRRKNTHKKN